MQQTEPQKKMRGKHFRRPFIALCLMHSFLSLEGCLDCKTWNFHLACFIVFSGFDSSGNLTLFSKVKDIFLFSFCILEVTAKNSQYSVIQNLILITVRLKPFLCRRNQPVLWHCSGTAVQTSYPQGFTCVGEDRPDHVYR